ncbi:manganese and iron superoxide dismutase [Cubamyces sp. BRFM 1775]|nr:manganese and iron superoxide dismutase [Cubamyces sp. BRFM 1775]
MSAFGLRLSASASRATRLASVSARACRVQSRALHKRKELSYPVDGGLGTFLPPHTLKMIAEDYQQGLLDRLNDQVRGTALENKSIVQTVVEAARDPTKVLEFNYASEALNNSFFLECVKPPPEHATSHEHSLIGSYVHRRIGHHWGSLAHFQSSFSAAVLGMFSSGWVWLVTDKNGMLGIVPTFGTGTLLVRSGKPSETFLEWQRLAGEAVVPFSEHELLPPSSSSPSSGSPPPPPPTSPASGLSHTAPPVNPHQPARSMSRYTGRSANLEGAEKSLDPERIGEVLYPLLCVSVHEHAWVGAGYGVWGKEEYMKRFWTVVDWHKVNSMYTKVAPPQP